MSMNLNRPSAGVMERWQRVARRIRVPLGFLTAALYIFELCRHAPRPYAIAWSLVLVLPGLWLRAYASGYVKKNTELTVTGPYAYTRNPLYLGSMLIAAGFALAIESPSVALLLAAGFALIYIPVIAGEENFLRSTFPSFDDYCLRVPRLIPRLAPAQIQLGETITEKLAPNHTPSSSFSFALYLNHREYNAAIGAALLYLCLIGLYPVLAVLFHHAR